MARKKKTPSDAKAKSDSDLSKAEAISGAVKDADFDTPDAAMADTSLETGDDAKRPEEPSDSDTSDTNSETSDVIEAEVLDTAPADDADEGHDGSKDDDTVADAEVSVVETQVVVPPVVPQSPPQKGGFFGPFLGGVVAAVIGFGGAVYFGAADWPVFGGNVKEQAMEAQISEQAALIEELSGQIATLSDTVTSGQSADADALAQITERLDALPTTTAELMPDDLRALLAAQKEEMDELQANLDKMAELAQGQIASAQAQQESAAAAEARAKARGALNAVRTALSGGGSYAAALPDIQAAADVPEVLQANAETGVPTSDTLEQSYGPAARSALSASLKATAGDAPTERLALFLKDQLGARSLTPREGDDPDAVLSRIEASVRSGDLDAALELISSLPEAGQAELSGWAEQVATRKDALAAFESLSDALSAN